MQKKQNNDDLKNTNLTKTSSHLLDQKGKSTILQSQRDLKDPTQQQGIGSVRMSKRHSQLSSAKQSQLPTMTSNLNPSTQTLLPISIHELQEKQLNQYLKQFMEITSFQTIQKGKQLIDLVKQAPGSKQTASVIGKCFKLFKSNIPDAVLCSFQFFRQLVEVGHWRITDAIEDLLLMPMVEIVQYRAYLPHMERGNTYFLNQIYRYGQDDKTNHLVKIGSTFFRMVHQVLYVWGEHYFPDTKFSKMLSKLMISESIKFPQFPHQFRFYSQPRVELYKNLIQKNKQIHLKQELEYKAKKSPQKAKDNSKNQQIKETDIKYDHEKPLNTKQKDSKLYNKKQPSIMSASLAQKKSFQQKQVLQRQKSSIQKESKVISKLQLKQQQKSPSKQPQQQSTISKIKQQSEDELQSIVLKHQATKQEKQQKVEQKKAHFPSKGVQEFKRIKPSKTKSKKSTLSIYQSQKSIQMQKSKVQSFRDAENVLNMIQQVEKIEIYQPKEQKFQMVDSAKFTEQKKIETKQAIKVEAVKQKNERSQSLIVVSNPVQTKDIKMQAEQTFRYVEKPSNSFKEQQNYSIRIQHDNQPSTVRVMSSERERYIDSVSEESRQGQTNSFAKAQMNQKPNIPNSKDSAIKDFFRSELQYIKSSIIEGVKEDIMRIIDQKTNITKKNLNHCQKLQAQAKNVLEQVRRQSIRNNQQKSDQQIVSARFGTNPTLTYADPSTQALEFFKKKFKKRKKLRNSSKLKRPSILLDEELAINNHKLNSIGAKQNFEQPLPATTKIVTDLGVNTDVIMQQRIFDQINSLKQKLNLMTASLSKPNPLSTKRNNNFFAPPNTSNSFFKTPITINKNQLQDINKSENQKSQLRSTIHTPRKKSKSKLSERRSSLEAALLQKAVLRPQTCGDFFEELYGGPKTLLFNAAVNSVQKKRKSVIFC